MPDSLTFGAEIAISTKMGLPYHRTTLFYEMQNNDNLKAGLDLLEKM